MRRPLIALTVSLLSLSPAIAKNVPGIVVAPNPPSPGWVLLLPSPGAAVTSADRKNSRLMSEKAVAELLPGGDTLALTKAAKLYVTGGIGTIDATDVERLRRMMSGCKVEASADLPLVEKTPAKEYYVVQLACPYEGKPDSKMFAAVGVTSGSVASVALNVVLTPVWSDQN